MVKSVQGLLGFGAWGSVDVVDPNPYNPPKKKPSARNLSIALAKMVALKSVGCFRNEPPRKKHLLAIAGLIIGP